MALQSHLAWRRGTCDDAIVTEPPFRTERPARTPSHAHRLRASWPIPALTVACVCVRPPAAARGRERTPRSSTRLCSHDASPMRSSHPQPPPPPRARVCRARSHASSARWDPARSQRSWRRARLRSSTTRPQPSSRARMASAASTTRKRPQLIAPSCRGARPTRVMPRASSERPSSAWHDAARGRRRAAAGELRRRTLLRPQRERDAHGRHPGRLLTSSSHRASSRVRDGTRGARRTGDARREATATTGPGPAVA